MEEQTRGTRHFVQSLDQTVDPAVMCETALWLSKLLIRGLFPAFRLVFWLSTYSLLSWWAIMGWSEN